MVHACMWIDACTRVRREAGDVSRFSGNVNAEGVNSRNANVTADVRVDPIFVLNIKLMGPSVHPAPSV